MNEKFREGRQKTFLAVGVVLVCALFSFGAAGCATRPVVIDPNAALVGSMDSLRQLREINERSLSIIADYNKFVTEQSAVISRAGADFREVLRRYDEFVLELVRRIEELEELSRGVDAEILQGADTAYHSVRALRNELGRQSPYVRALAKEDTGAPVARHSDMTALARMTAQRVTECLEGE